MEQNIMLSWGHIWAIVAGIFGVGAFFYKLTDKKFEKQDAKIDKLIDHLCSFEKNTEHRLTKLEVETTTELRNINQRLSTIEGYLVPRKVFHIEEPPREEPKEN
jgi:hypothetical protein